MPSSVRRALGVGKRSAQTRGCLLAGPRRPLGATWFTTAVLAEPRPQHPRHKPPTTITLSVHELVPTAIFNVICDLILAPISHRLAVDLRRLSLDQPRDGVDELSMRKHHNVFRRMSRKPLQERLCPRYKLKE